MIFSGSLTRKGWYVCMHVWFTILLVSPGLEYTPLSFDQEMSRLEELNKLLAEVEQSLNKASSE